MAHNHNQNHKHYTLDGVSEVLVASDGRKHELKPVIPEFKGYPRRWQPYHKNVLLGLNSLIEIIKAQDPNRKIPLLQKEITKVIDFRKVKELEKMKLVEISLVNIFQQKEAVEKQIVVWITPEGKSVLEEIKKDGK